VATIFWHNAGQPVCVRIAYVTESFPPDINGVAHTALRVAEHLVKRGHEPLVIAPEPADGQPRPDCMLGYPVVRVPSTAVPVYPGLRVGLPGPRLRTAVAAHKADLVHLAGPFVLGASGGAAGVARSSICQPKATASAPASSSTASKGRSRPLCTTRATAPSTTPAHTASTA